MAKAIEITMNSDHIKNMIRAYCGQVVGHVKSYLASRVLCTYNPIRRKDGNSVLWTEKT